MKFSKETEEYRREIEKLKAEDHTESKVARGIRSALKYIAWVVLVLTGLLVVVLLDNTGGYISVPAMFLAFILLFMVPLARLKKKAGLKGEYDFRFMEDEGSRILPSQDPGLLYQDYVYFGKPRSKK